MENLEEWSGAYSPKRLSQARKLTSTLSAISDVNDMPNQVAETFAIGDPVGVTAYASDPGFTVIYSLDDNAGGRFAINGATGVVTKAAPVLYSEFTAHTIVVRATSSRDTSSVTAAYVIQVVDPNSVSSYFATGYFATGYYAVNYFAKGAGTIGTTPSTRYFKTGYFNSGMFAVGYFSAGTL